MITPLFTPEGLFFFCNYIDNVGIGGRQLYDYKNDDRRTFGVALLRLFCFSALLLYFLISSSSFFFLSLALRSS